MYTLMQVIFWKPLKLARVFIILKYLFLIELLLNGLGMSSKNWLARFKKGSPFLK